MSPRIKIILNLPAIILFLIIFVGEYIVFASLDSVYLIKSTPLETILIVTGIILPIIFIGSMLFSYNHYSKFNSWLNTVNSFLFGLLVYIFIASIIILLFSAFNHYFDLRLPIKLISILLIILILGLMFYGAINSRNIRIVRYNIKSDRLRKDWSGKKIVIVSDIHIGNINRKKFLEKVVNTMNAENPDITFNLGDLIDGACFPYKEWLSPLLTLEAKIGNYYIEGNHEQYNQEQDKFKTELPITLSNITSKKVILSNTQIIGLNYHESRSREKIKSRLISLSYNPDIPSIVLMHNPKNTKILSQNGVSLVLSGHTHDGQLFPWTIWVKQLYKKYSYGLSYTDNTISITSAGVGTSVIPLRIGTNPEIIVLNIN
jgi:uncharacterized protein